MGQIKKKKGSELWMVDEVLQDYLYYIQIINFAHIIYDNKSRALTL